CRALCLGRRPERADRRSAHRIDYRREQRDSGWWNVQARVRGLPWIRQARVECREVEGETQSGESKEARRRDRGSDRVDGAVRGGFPIDRALALSNSPPGMRRGRVSQADDHGARAADRVVRLEITVLVK